MSRRPFLRALRWLSAPGRNARVFLWRLWNWWRRLRPRHRYPLAAVIVLAAIAVPFGVFTWSGVSAALDARQAYQELQAEMSRLTPVDLIQLSVYRSLEGRFQEAEETSARARSRLGFLRVFDWLPFVGDQIKDVRILLDMGYYQGRAGRILTNTYQAAIPSALEELSPDEAARHVARVLREAAPKLNQANEDLRRVAKLRKRLGASQRGTRYGIVVDRYLPASQTVVYLSLSSPEAIGHTYTLSRELSLLQDLAEDPLDILANPKIAGQALGIISEQATALERAFEVVRRANKQRDVGDPEEVAAVNDVLDTLVPGITLLRHVTAGTQSLVTIAEATETTGFLSKEFGSVAEGALDRAHQELSLAKQEVASLQTLLSMQGIDPEAFLPSIGFGDDGAIPIGSPDRVEDLLDEAINATNFLRSFLGFEGQRNYLLIGQNQNEIRATGGFIGIAIEAKIDRGELTEIVYHDSTTVDRQPLTDNPTPPDWLFWYLWMERLLFRDSNYNVHFPAAAAKVAEMFHHGQGIQVDGVITASKLLAWDLVDLFGDVTVEGVEGALTKEQAVAYTEGELPYECLPHHVSAATRGGKRCFDEELFLTLRDRLTFGVSAHLRTRLMQLVKEQLDRKNILIHVFPPIDDSFLWERGWNGAVPLVDHDYLMVVDSSLPGHSNVAIQRSLDYTVSLNPDQPFEAHLRLRYENIAQPKDRICSQFSWDPVYPCYWNYFRVYISSKASTEKIQMPPVPLHEGSAKLIWGYPDADSASIVPDADTGPSRLTELGGYIAVEPGSVTTVPIQYTLPPDILRSSAPNVYEYRLLIQKQAGMDKDQVSLAIQLPPEAELLATSPEYNSIRGQWLFFDFTLESDTTAVVSFQVK